MPNSNDYVTREHFDQVIKEKFDKVMEKLDWLIGKYTAHDQEHILLNGKVSEHSDDIEIIKQKVGIQL